MRGLPPVLRVLLRKREKPVYKVHERSVTHVVDALFVLHIQPVRGNDVYRLSSPSRALSDRTANMCVQVPGGFLRQLAERRV